MKNIKLFDYQEDMKERIEKALRLHRSVMAQMPTGTGKTVLLASVVESFLREHSNCNVWIVAHRRELVSQIRETIQRVFSKTPSLLYKDFSNHPVNSSKITPSLFTLKEGNFPKTHPSSLTLKEGSTSHLGLLQWSLHPLRFPRLRGTETSGKKRKTVYHHYSVPTILQVVTRICFRKKLFYYRF